MEIEKLNELFQYPGRGGLGFMDLMRLTLQLDWDSPIDLPHIPDVWRQEALIVGLQAGMVPGNSVILFPDNNSVPSLPESFWQVVAEEFTAKGVTVMCNMVGRTGQPRTQPIPGTLPIMIPLHLAIPLVELAGRHVSGNNGLMFLLAGSKAQSKLTLVINNMNFDLNGHKSKNQIKFQSFQHAGCCEQPIREYVYDTSSDVRALARDIVEDNPETALEWK